MGTNICGCNDNVGQGGETNVNFNKIYFTFICLV